MKAKLIRAYKEFILRSSSKGPYKFLLEKLSNKMDVELASSIFQSDYYRGQLKPLPVETGIMKKVLVFAPHQDDEVIGCGGLMAYLKTQNCDLHICFLTDGAPGDNNRDMVATRQKEAQKVCEQLSATMHEIGINNVDLKVGDEHLSKIEELLSSEFDTVFLPWVFDGPPKHRLCNAVLEKCMKALKWKTQELHCYQVHTHLLPNAFFEYSSLKSEKELLLDLYPSQMKEQNYKHLSLGLDAWSSRFLGWSEKERYVELFTRIPAEAFYDLMKLYSKDVAQTFKSNAVCIASYKYLQV
jgi:LmbE family N-acetylglucosaminyl deacetylase